MAAEVDFSDDPGYAAGDYVSVRTGERTITRRWLEGRIVGPSSSGGRGRYDVQMNAARPSAEPKLERSVPFWRIRSGLPSVAAPSTTVGAPPAVGLAAGVATEAGADALNTLSETSSPGGMGAELAGENVAAWLPWLVLALSVADKAVERGFEAWSLRAQTRQAQKIHEREFKQTADFHNLEYEQSQDFHVGPR